MPGSAQTTSNNTVPVNGSVAPPYAAEPDTATAGRLGWPIGTMDDVDHGGQVFEVTFKSTVGSPSGHSSGDVEGNLMKFSYENTAGTAFPLRDRTDFELKVPPISLVKGVRQINGAGPVFGPNSDHKQIIGGDSVQYRVDVTNPGTDPLTGVRVWDKLPTGITCADLTGPISDGGVCDAGTNTIKWPGLSLAAGPGTTKTLTYTVHYPLALSPDQTFTNTAGVVEYTYTTNDGQPYQLIPNNPTVKDPALPAANVPKAEDPSDVFTQASAVVKTRTTSITDTGNNAASQATIGERIDYTVTTTIPKDTTLYGTPDRHRRARHPSDARARQPLLAAPARSTGSTCRPAASASPSRRRTRSRRPSRPPTRTRPATTSSSCSTSASASTTCAANANGGSLPNTATLTYKDQLNRTVTKSGSVSTALVEPRADDRQVLEPGRLRRGQRHDHLHDQGQERGRLAGL